jgi:hypothetical protein
MYDIVKEIVYDLLVLSRAFASVFGRDLYLSTLGGLILAMAAKTSSRFWQEWR